MPNYILIYFLILINSIFSYSQYEKRKIGVDKTALNKIAQQKVAALQEDIKLNDTQIIKIKKIYLREAYKIDSLKFLSPDFFEDPMRSREIILEIKHQSEAAMLNLLSPKQRQNLLLIREEKRKKAFERLQSR